MNAKEITKYDDDQLHDMYDDMLNELGIVEIGSITLQPSEVLKKCDPIAYRCGFNDWEDSFSRDNPITAWECDECGEEFETEEDANECCKPEEEEEEEEE